MYMLRTRRFVCAGKPFELDIRVKEGLPFACVGIIKLIIHSDMARAQRDGKLPTSCSYSLQQLIEDGARGV